MPRTKRPKKTQENTGVKENVSKKLDKIVVEEKANIDSLVHMECRNIDLAFKILLGTLSNTVLTKTIGQLKSQPFLPTNTNRKTRNSSRPTSHDDGYLTETSLGSAERGKNLLGPATTGRASRSRSADASARKTAAAPCTAAKQRRRSRSVLYRTPAYNKTASKHYPNITPKMAPHTPLTLLRHARQGEMLVSMSGSPVMPTGGSIATDSNAHCNFPLKDGTMLSLQPNQLRQSQAFIPFTLMDPTVLHQLKTLKDNLDKVVKMGENVVKTADTR